MRRKQNSRGADYDRELGVAAAPHRQIVVPKGHSNIHKIFRDTVVGESMSFRSKTAVNTTPINKQAIKQTKAHQHPNTTATTHREQSIVGRASKSLSGVVSSAIPKSPTGKASNTAARPKVCFEDIISSREGQPATHVKLDSSTVAAKRAQASSNKFAHSSSSTPVHQATTAHLRNNNNNKGAITTTDETAGIAFSPFDPLPANLEEEARRVAKSRAHKKDDTANSKAIAASSRKMAKEARQDMKKKREAIRAKRREAKQARLENVVKLAALESTSVVNIASAERALASAAVVGGETSPKTNMAITDARGAAALPREGVMARLANMPRVTFTFNINTARLFAVLRALAVTLIIAVSAYLAWDTWMTNRTVENTLSNPASAMSIEGANPTTADPTSISDQQWSAHMTPADQPRYIYIPSINVKARVMSVGVTSKGNIDTPKNLNDTAWYDGSAKPNQNGQVFIDGHTSFNNNLAAAFNDLPKLQKDSQITIELGNGDKVSYKVIETETVATNDVDMNKALNAPGDAEKGLTLMTCAGVFDYRTQNASERYIVYAVQI